MKEKRLTRGEAIRAKCLECCCDSVPEVRSCNIKKCPLWPYRMGRESKVDNLSTEHSEV